MKPAPSGRRRRARPQPTLPPFPHFPPFTPFAACLAAALVLAGCITDQSKRGTIVDNETRVGRLYLADGSAAAGARVRIFPVGHQPDTASAGGSADPAYATRTDGAGGFSVEGLSPGEYNILGEKDGAYSIQDSVFLGGAGGDLPPDTLKAPGSLSGTVALQVNHNPLTAIVQVLGTYVYANVGADGRFRLGNLAEGRYTLRVSTSEEGYTPLFAAVRVAAGRDDVLPDTLRPVYTGIPVVTGLRAVYDTADAVVRLAWDSVAFRDFSEFIVFRDPQGSLTPGLQPIGSASEPRFDDSLQGRGGKGGVFLPSDTGVQLLEYRVKVRDKSDRLGLSYGSRKVAAVGPAHVRIQYRLSLLGIRWDAVKQADEVTIVVELSSPKRGLRHVRWTVPAPGAPGDSTVSFLRDLGGAAAAADTLAFDLRREGRFRVRFHAEDMAGSSVADSLTMNGNVAPGPKGPYPAEITVTAGDTVDIDRSAFDWDEDTLTYSSRGLPAWIRLDSLRGVLRVAAGNAQAGTHPGIVVIAHDGRRAYELPPLAVTVKPGAWENGPSAPFASGASSAVALGDRIYLVGPSIGGLRSMLVFDPVAGTWMAGPDLPDEVLEASVVGADGKIFVIGGVRPDSPQVAVNSVWAFDPAVGTWSARKPMPTARTTATAAASGGRIHVIGGSDGDGRFLNAVEEYDPALDAWTPRPPAPFNLSASDQLVRGRAVDVGGTIYMMGWDMPPNYLSSDEVRAYHPATGTWSVKRRQLARRSLLSACAAGGKIYAAGGYTTGTPRSDMDVYDPATDAWSARTPMKAAGIAMACAEHSGSIYFFQGSVGPDGAGTRVDIYHPDLDPGAPAGAADLP